MAARVRLVQYADWIFQHWNAGMVVKTLVIVFLLVILFTLGSSFFYMVKDKGQGTRTLHRLMWRIGLSLFLLLLLYVMYLLGWIEPTGGPVNYNSG